MTIQEEKSLRERQQLANTHYEQRQKKSLEQQSTKSDPKQGHIDAPLAEQAKNSICKKQKLQMRKYLIGGEGKQNDNMLATITSFIPFEGGQIINVGCLPWVVIGEFPLNKLDRVEVTA